MTQRGVERIYATGRRKSATARVFLSPAGTGQILINKRPLEDYFRRESQRMLLHVPLEVTATAGQVDLWVTVRGGGPSGQAGAVRHGISRALEKLNPDHRAALKKAGLLTRDSRIKERKKYGQRGARARFQFSKR
jgi:small subunit ribosomal protein S9